MDPRIEHPQPQNHPETGSGSAFSAVPDPISGAAPSSVFSAARDPVTGEFSVKKGGPESGVRGSESNATARHDPAPRTQDAGPAIDHALELDLRLYARIEGATILLQSFVNAGRSIMQEREAAGAAPITDDESVRHEREGEVSVTMVPEPGADIPPAQSDSPDEASAKSGPKLRRPYRPRVHATPMMILSFRAATRLLDAAKLCNTLGRELLRRGVDLEQAVNKRRVSDYVLEFLRECGVDIVELPKNDLVTLRRALDRIDDVIAEGVKQLHRLPGMLEAGRRRRELESNSPQGP